MDHVLANKAVFKGTTDKIGRCRDHRRSGVASGPASSAQSQRRDWAGVDRAGLIAKIFSAATTPEADTRTWDNLPQFISFADLEARAGRTRRNCGIQRCERREPIRI
jgi:hypothetical protein